jgi:phosphoribosylanthranilate isomerase
MTRVKCCGITCIEDVMLCAEEGAHALGFVVEYPQPVPWNLSRAQARELMASVPPFVARVAVVGGEAATIVAIAESTGAQAVQLHADEPESVVEVVAKTLAPSGVKVIKALRIDPFEPARDAFWWQSAAQRFYNAGADALLIDSKTSARPAGTGAAVDWQIARAVVTTAPCPVILAGGLSSANVAQAIAEVRPYAVDVISSIEDGAHRKVRERVRAFVRTVVGASSGSR